MRGTFNLYAIIDNLIATAGPGESTTIKFSTELIDYTIPSNIEYYNSQSVTDGSLSMKVNFRECQSGEAFLDDGACEE